MLTLEGVSIRGALGERYDEVLTPEALEFLVQLHRRFAARRKELLAAACAAAGAAGPRGMARLPARDPAHPRAEWQVAPHPARPRGPAGGDHRARGPQDDDQRPQLRGPGVHGRLRGRQRPHLGQHHRGPDQPHRCRGRHDHLHQPRRPGLPAEGEGRRRSWCGPGAGTCPSSTSWSTASRSPAAWSTSACTSSTTPGGCWRRAAGRTSTCPSWRATWRRGSGTMSSASPRTTWASPAGRSRRQC